MAGIAARKEEHLDLCARGPVEHGLSGLLDEVGLIHNSLPERSLAEVDLSTELFGRRLWAPVLIGAMTGGTPRAGRINRALARVAARHGFGLGLGSQRIMLEGPDVASSFQIREVAPDIPLLANLGAVQARDAGTNRVRDLIETVGADALCIHLNPAQELVQQEGDRDFRGCLAGIARLAQGLPVPVVVKETGCGLGPRALARLRAAGVQWVDVAGAGGTSWTGVESLRGSRVQQRIGRALHDWGIPTAASVVFARKAGLHTIASGGIRTGLDAARALALGAEAVSLALPFLRALEAGGAAAADELAIEIAETLRRVTLLTGGVSLDDLRRAPHVLGPTLRAWVSTDAASDRRSSATSAGRTDARPFRHEIGAAS